MFKKKKETKIIMSKIHYYSLKSESCLDRELNWKASCYFINSLLKKTREENFFFDRHDRLVMIGSWTKNKLYYSEVFPVYWKSAKITAFRLACFNYSLTAPHGCHCMGRFKYILQTFRLHSSYKPTSHAPLVNWQLLLWSKDSELF